MKNEYFVKPIHSILKPCYRIAVSLIVGRRNGAWELGNKVKRHSKSQTNHCYYE